MTDVYNQGALELVNGTLAWATMNAYAILVGSGYTFSAAHTTYADVSANEIADADYAPQDVATKSVALNADVVEYDCADISFGDPVTINAAGGRIVILAGDEAAPAAGDRLLFSWALPSPGESSNSEFTVTTPNGVWSIDLTPA